MAVNFPISFSLNLFLTAIVIGGVYSEYDTKPRIVPEKINVHLVPHSHDDDDVGWLKNVDQYYVGANNSIRGACVQNVLDSVIASLLDDENRKFIYVEMAFFQRWWRQQSKTKKVEVKKLVDSGQLEFINGGMCIHDEATPHYIDMIDQTTLGHQFIKSEFGQVPRVGWHINPFGHSAVQAYLLGAEALTLSPYQEELEHGNGNTEATSEAKDMIAKVKSEFEAKISDDLNTCGILTGTFQDTMKFINVSITKLKRLTPLIAPEIGDFENWIKTMEFDCKKITAAIRNIHEQH